MLELLLEPAALPFSVALGLMLAITLLELVSVILGLGVSQFFESLLPDADLPDVDLPDVDLPDADLPDADLPGGPVAEGLSSPGFFSLVAAWLCIGRVPVMIILIAFLTVFGLAGLVVQQLATTLGGGPLPVLVAVAAALLIGLPLTRYLALAFAWILPQEETEAVEEAEFLGQTAEVFRGTAVAGQPAEAKLADRFGQMHYLLVEPPEGAAPLPAGTRVVLLARKGAAYLAAAQGGT